MLVHRGPDDAGHWTSSSGKACLGHQRLSILDLSGAGRQPMTRGDLTICFNGEIYNFRELRAELEGHGVRFETQSDTEVILRLYEREGIASVRRLRGMFAFAIWDEANGLALLARDPLGIKPLYVYKSHGRLLFASELRALVGCGRFEVGLDEDAVGGYLTMGSVPEPLTLVKDVKMLEAGNTLTWQSGEMERLSYWQIGFLGGEAPRDPVGWTRNALLESVRHHFVSDVPVGLFLSGGIDSTALLALANEVGHSGIRAFCVGVDDPAADESDVARRTAQHFGAQYEELRLDAHGARELFSDYLEAVDQPSIDGLNTFTVSALARREGVKVVLSGLGGDELFGGYASFQKIPKMLRAHRFGKMVPGTRLGARLLLRRKPQGRRLSEFLGSCGSVVDAYSSMRGIFSQAEAGALTRWLTGSEMDLSYTAGLTYPTDLDAVSAMELTRYMRNQLLRDSDVMSMAHGLELRVPFVDRVLFEAVARVPARVRLQEGKRLLTDAVPEVPEWVVNQKKRGFLFPFQKWLGAEWGEMLDVATRGAPVPVVTWYQRWSIFMLRHAAQRLGLSLQ
jgi:asparagine synthase (glutamine-hydrolysing)